jgi:hypothetical protein
MNEKKMSSAKNRSSRGVPQKEKLSKRERIKRAVDRVVDEYGETLRKLGKE